MFANHLLLAIDFLSGFCSLIYLCFLWFGCLKLRYWQLPLQFVCLHVQDLVGVCPRAYSFSLLCFQTCPFALTFVYFATCHNAVNCLPLPVWTFPSLCLKFASAHMCWTCWSSVLLERPSCLHLEHRRWLGASCVDAFATDSPRCKH